MWEVHYQDQQIRHLRPREVKLLECNQSYYVFWKSGTSRPDHPHLSLCLVPALAARKDPHPAQNAGTFRLFRIALARLLEYSSGCWFQASPISSTTHQGQI